MSQHAVLTFSCVVIEPVSQDLYRSQRFLHFGCSHRCSGFQQLLGTKI